MDLHKELNSFKFNMYGFQCSKYYLSDLELFIEKDGWQYRNWEDLFIPIQYSGAARDFSQIEPHLKSGTTHLQNVDNFTIPPKPSRTIPYAILQGVFTVKNETLLTIKCRRFYFGFGLGVPSGLLLFKIGF
uniref:hypothetical protein n=1 Tax=Hydrocytium acuminatum TaxID=1745963 RepID=UPI002A8056F9|nr:hypothetical protein UYM18_pgp037 [Hydrocytium acuminatum]WOR09580.1 hypothetical protein [Hydrocytium acuminatum]